MKILELNQENLEILKSKLNAGYPIIVPTDTNYNLCCLPDNRMAINRIFEYKIRPKNKLSLFSCPILMIGKNMVRLHKQI